MNEFYTSSWIPYADAFCPENGILWIQDDIQPKKPRVKPDYPIASKFIDEVAKISRADGKIPDEETLWRECYSFSELENRAFSLAMKKARDIETNTGWEISIETDAIGNMYIHVAGQKEESGEEFETHMVGSHLDSVENGGKYDGPAGIAAGMAVLEAALLRQKKSLQNSLTFVIFRSEESSPNNGIACLWSSIATWIIDGEKLENIVYTTNKDTSDKIYLKDHLESSLQAYFEAKKRESSQISSLRSRQEYIDMDWWDFFCEQNGITSENYSSWDWWKKILELQKKPKITNEKYSSYRELHIEQWTILEDAKVDVGIVSEWIWGAKRFETQEKIPVKYEEVDSSAYSEYSFVLEWKSDHTGSTPNNSSLENFDYRRDALIGSALFLREFLQKDLWELIACEPTSEKNEWFTSVPHSQRIRLAIKNSEKETFKKFLEQKTQEFSKNKNIRFTEKKVSALEENSITCISKHDAKKSIDSLLQISEGASKEFKKQRENHPEEKKYGTTRATVTDYRLDIHGLSFRLDVREVNTDDCNLLIESISSALQDMISWWVECLNKISEKLHQEIDATMRDKAQEIAKILWLTYELIPSVPGHDADRIAQAGIAIAMFFVRQKDGLSHNPGEKMSNSDFNKALQLFLNATLADLV